MHFLAKWLFHLFITLLLSSSIYSNNLYMCFNEKKLQISIKSCKWLWSPVIADCSKNPKLSLFIVGELKNPEFFCYEDEAKHAVANNTEPEDVQEERRKINQADLVILVFPMYNLGVPAILKGRV